jgi:hypothetical protein
MSICVYMQYMVYMVYMVYKCVYYCMLYAVCVYTLTSAMMRWYMATTSSRWVALGALGEHIHIVCI